MNIINVAAVEEIPISYIMLEPYNCLLILAVASFSSERIKWLQCCTETRLCIKLMPVMERWGFAISVVIVGALIIDANASEFRSRLVFDPVYTYYYAYINALFMYRT